MRTCPLVEFCVPCLAATFLCNPPARLLCGLYLTVALLQGACRGPVLSARCRMSAAMPAPGPGKPW